MRGDSKSRAGRRLAGLRQRSAGIALAGVVALATALLTAGPASASATNCANTGTGHSAVFNYVNSNGTWNISWYQVWDKASRACTDFYLTYQATTDSYAGLYKTAGAGDDWNVGDSGYHRESAGSGEAPAGTDLVTNLAIGAQLNVIAQNHTDVEVHVAF